MKPAQTVEHPCLVHGEESQAESVQPADAEMTDRARLALTLQAAALIAHLNAAGWELIGGLDRGRVVDGTLTGLRAQPGRDDTSAHQRLRQFILQLFSSESEIVGRGQGRRSARKLTSAWSQPLAQFSSDEILGQILHHAPFLWDEEFKVVRHALFAVVNGEHPPRVVGPAAFRLRAGRKLQGGCSVDEVVDDADLRSDWEGAVAVDAAESARRGRWAESASTFRVQGVRGDEQRHLFASSLQAMGKFEQALEVIKRLRDPRAERIRLHSLTRLQRLEAARRLLLKLRDRRHTPRELVDVGDIAVRVFRNLGDLERVEEWRERLRRVRSQDAAPFAQASLVGAAYDAGEMDRAEEHLELSVGLRDDRLEGWRWHYADGLCGLGRGDGSRAEQGFRTALLEYRRHLTRVRAALVWTNLVSAAELLGDLAAAERAARTAFRLGMGFEGPLRNAILLYNLAETLLKRGKVDGVRELLDEVESADWRAGHRRGVVQDAELKARYHLTRGRPDRALRALDEVMDEHEEEEWRRHELLAWSARSLGLLGRPDEARARLEDGGSDGLSVFDAEEIPAIWMLAGDPEKATTDQHGPVAMLWRSVIAGETPSRESWQGTDLLDSYRGARLIRDLELCRPGSTPRRSRLRAIRTLRELGLERVAQQLEGMTGGAWSAVTEYLDLETGGDLSRLFDDAGYGDIRLEWDGPDAEVLVDGRGGVESHEVEVGLGRLILGAPAIDQPLLALVGLAARVVERRRGSTAAPSRAPGGIVGESPALRSALNDVRLLAPSGLPIMILGETGTGKELVARWVHERSDRSGGPFLPVNCAAIPDSLRSSELFGHTKGAFTGADRDRAGYFESASGGTIFLDEIGDLSLEAQAGLLRVLQEGEVMRVGESRARKVDTRVVAATHRDLRKMLDAGVFRQDLYYRLSQSLVGLPPLRDRGEDLVLLARHFLAEDAAGTGTLTLTREAIERLRRHTWPGNVRELRSVLRTAAVFSEDGRIESRHLRLDDDSRRPLGDLQAEVNEFRRIRIVEELERAGGNQAEAARALGMTRQGLSYWIKKLGIRP